MPSLNPGLRIALDYKDAMWKGLCSNSFSYRSDSDMHNLTQIHNNPHLSRAEAILSGEQLGGEKSI